MAISEHEQRQFEQIASNLAKEGFGDRRSPVARWFADKRQGLKDTHNQWKTAPSWLRRLGLYASTTAVMSTAGFALVAVTEAVGRNRDELALRAAVATALQNSRILAVTGTCSLELTARAIEVDAMAQSEDRRDMGYDGPTSIQLRQAADMAEAAEVPCVPLDDGAYTMQVNGRPVTLQQSDLLWINPDIR